MEGVNKRCFCPPVAYIANNSRTESPNLEWKFPTLNVTCTPVSRPNGQRSGLQTGGGIPCRPNPAGTLLVQQLFSCMYVCCLKKITYHTVYYTIMNTYRHVCWYGESHSRVILNRTCSSSLRVHCAADEAMMSAAADAVAKCKSRDSPVVAASGALQERWIHDWRP